MSIAMNTYCSVPCPFFCPASAPKGFGGAPPPRKPSAVGRTYYEYEDYEDLPECPPQRFRTRYRQIEIPKPDPKPEPKPEPPKVKKPKPPPEESAPEETTQDSVPRKKERCSCPCPSPPPKRFFASLCSIPGAVVDTMLSGEITV
ncbi:hypothetical protein B5X24_HaOG210776 [Helicoverpa armigera]|uniref:Uncharacterized protein n=1 Tax=Helicoverpa armigera TaxID=29058 RepID=A0A2W1BIJ0_HELAM|nr:hypothetical protein B5X24_HaOG210776 [Helicoverpa armigera]